MSNLLPYDLVVKTLTIFNMQDSHLKNVTHVLNHTLEDDGGLVYEACRASF